MTTQQDAIRKELADAEAARRAGNEGRARVCARRAAGIAARDWLTLQGFQVGSASTYETLKMLAEFPALDPDLLQAAIHLTMRVTEAFTLPEGVDLIEDALLIARKLGAKA